MKITALELFDLFETELAESLKNQTAYTINATGNPNIHPHTIYRLAGVSSGLALAQQILAGIREQVRDNDEFGIEDDKDD